MIQVRNLSKAYGTEVLFEDISFNIGPKELIGLVGRNGEGKTTLFNLILGLVEPDAGAISVLNNYSIGHLDQHISFSQETVLKEGCLGLAADQKDDRWRVESILSGLGFSQEDMQGHPSNLSGGYQVRLSLAKLLVSDPDLLLLDEPTNYLDITSIRWLTRFLKSWKRELMLITHDRSFMDSVITHTIGIHRQKARKIAGTTEKYYRQILKEEEIYEQTRLNDEKKRKEIELFIRRFRAKAQLGSLVQSRIKSLQKREKVERLERLETLEFSFNAAPFPAKVMMEGQGIRFSYSGKAPYLISDFGITVRSYDRIAVVGKNGQGKSSLLRLLAGELAPLSGTLKSHPRLKIGYFGQTNVEKLNLQRTIEEEILSANPDFSSQDARNICGAMMFSGDLALKKVGVLSGGEKSRVLLGKVLVSPCNLLLLDEPTNHLDMESCDSLLAAIDSFAGAVIFATHNEMYLHTLANRLIVFDGGRIIVYEGSYQDFLDEIGWESDSLLRQARDNHKTAKDASSEAADQKALRQARTEIIRERSRALKPTAARIEQIEATIRQLEAELSKNNDSLVQASMEGDGQAIVALAKRNREISAQTEKLYEELDGLTQTYENESREFEEKLSSIPLF